MAILFSKVTMRDDDSEVNFLVNGIPKSSNDLEYWTAYHDFLDKITQEMLVNVFVRAFTYGDGDIYLATPSEVAYMVKRSNQDPKFLENHCKVVSDSEFNVLWHPCVVQEPILNNELNI